MRRAERYSDDADGVILTESALRLCEKDVVTENKLESHFPTTEINVCHLFDTSPIQVII